MINVVVFKIPNVLAEFGRVFVLSVAERCGMVPVSCFKFVLRKSDVRFCLVAVSMRYCCLIDD